MYLAAVKIETKCKPGMILHFWLVVSHHCFVMQRLPTIIYEISYKNVKGSKDKPQHSQSTRTTDAPYLTGVSHVRSSRIYPKLCSWNPSHAR